MDNQTKQLKILFLGNFGVTFSSESHHAKSLEALGHTVIRLQEREATADTILLESPNVDLFVWVHTHGWETPAGFNSGSLVTLKDVLQIFKKRGIPSVTYHLDLYMGIGREHELARGGEYDGLDHFFTVDKLMAGWLNQNTDMKGHYLPAGVYHEECYMAEPSGRSLDVVFVGSRGYHKEWPYRPKLIDWLKETYGERFHHFGGDGLGVVRGKELNQVYADAKVVVGDSLCINFNYPYYWSDRVYETLGRGGFLIHPYIKGLEEEFSLEKELITYKFGDFEELKSKIDYYLTHDEEREAIRIAGHEKVKNNYTYNLRWKKIIDTILNKHRWAHILKELNLGI